ncbi:MAG: hypothetical protein D3923_16580, partial [Candidatus Electrothrix sp. AR3]|nr:hypothetical protein [Candidatus Electrothrix sp. AR3]
PLTIQPVESMEIDLPIAELRLTGWLSSLHSRGRISFRPANLKARDLLQLWIQHLVLLLVQPAGVEPFSVHLASDKTVYFGEVAEPEAELASLVRLFQQGLCEPLHFYPTTSYAWAKAKSAASARSAAFTAWYTGYFRGEEEDPAYALGLRGQVPLDQGFEELTEVFGPVLAYVGDFEKLG